MAVLQFSDAVRDARNNAFETTVSTSPKLRLFSGAMPANCAAADSGTLLADISLPSDWMAASAAGVKQKLGVWTGVGHANAGVGMDVGHFRIKTTAGTITHCQGDVTVTGGGGAMTVDSITVIATQPINVTVFTLTDPNS